MQLQPEESKRGEIEFRRELVQKQVEGRDILENEYGSREMELILEERMEKTLQQMTALQKRGIQLSPYVEIGAERCQRSLVMENDLEQAGAAVDLSFDMLKSCDHYADAFERHKKPERICGDAYRLPFASGSVPFVFCYETLHHFPEPAPVIAEAYRILSPGGYFFFDEEPYRKVLHIDVYSRKRDPREAGDSAGLARRIVRHFFCKDILNELEYGIIENHDIPVRSWEEALGLFDEVSLELHSILNLTADATRSKRSLGYVLAYLNGGTLRGICRKAGTRDVEAKEIAELLICPLCLGAGCESSLNAGREELACSRCGTAFPVVDGVIILLPPQEIELLYPEKLS